MYILFESVCKIFVTAKKYYKSQTLWLRNSTAAVEKRDDRSS